MHPDTPIPKHIAIIMDGNGRWAKERSLPRLRGHLRGISAIKKITRECSDLGVKHLTLYSFSTENWKRPGPEVNFLFSLLKVYLLKERDELHRNRVRIRSIGQRHLLPAESRKILEDSIALTDSNQGMELIFALSYSGREELLTSARRFAEDCLAGKCAPADLTERLFATYLYTHDIPDPDLLIRTSGELRISNFLLWQIAYAELFVTNVYWPEFDVAELHKAIEAFGTRNRRFGGLAS